MRKDRKKIIEFDRVSKSKMPEEYNNFVYVTFHFHSSDGYKVSYVPSSNKWLIFKDNKLVFVFANYPTKDVTPKQALSFIRLYHRTYKEETQ